MSNSSDLQEIVRHDPETETYRATFDSTAIAPSMAVVELIAHVRETEPTELSPLYDAVDADALDQFCTNQTNSRREGGVALEFTYQRHRVRVESYGTIEVQPVSIGGKIPENGTRDESR